MGPGVVIGRSQPLHSGEMATQTIVQSLAYISWALLLGLAMGSFGLVWVLRQVTDATRGFVGFTALCSALLAGLALITDWSLPDPGQLAIDAAPQLNLARRVVLGLLVILAFASAIRLLRGHRARWLGIGAMVAGLGALGAAAIGWGGGSALGLPLLVQLVMLSAVSGGSLAAVVLAHWYLVTPRISERPLVLTTRLLTAAISLQLLLFFTWLAVPVPAATPFSALTGPNALLVWLRLLVGICFPLVLAFMAYRTARTRSMESATGLLYIELAAVLASTIVATGLAFAVGVVV